MYLIRAKKDKAKKQRDTPYLDDRLSHKLRELARHLQLAQNLLHLLVVGQP